jgi:hypothetical protein
MHYLLFYDVVTDYVTKRAPFRAAHLEYARRAVERDELLLGGALASPADGAVLLFSGASPAVAEAFAAADPYVLNGVVLTWRVREWTTVVGKDAAIHSTRSCPSVKHHESPQTPRRDRDVWFAGVRPGRRSTG